jgi:hypothetical protein
MAFLIAPASKFFLPSKTRFINKYGIPNFNNCTSAVSISLATMPHSTDQQV